MENSNGLGNHLHNCEQRLISIKPTIYFVKPTIIYNRLIKYFNQQGRGAVRGIRTAGRGG